MLTELAASILPMTTSANSAGSTAMAVLVVIASVAYLALFIGALVSIMQSTAYSTGTKALWILVCFITPFIGSIVWFIWGRRG